MPNRTQTLLVALTREEIKLLLGGRDPDPTSQEATDRERARGKLRTVLSQPEGDEGAAPRVRERLRELAEDWERQAGEAFKQCRPDIPTTPAEGEAKGVGEGFATAANALRELLDCTLPHLPAQPPAPVLSDERKRLSDIALRLRGLGMTGPEAEQLKADADFLRNLASQEHRGEEIDPRISNVRYNHPAEGCHTLKLDLRVALKMAEENGGSVDVYLSDHEAWFPLVEGPHWRISTLRAALGGSDV